MGAVEADAHLFGMRVRVDGGEEGRVGDGESRGFEKVVCYRLYND